MRAALLADGRLHLQDGPIDLLCGAWGDEVEVRTAYGQAVEAFPAVLPGLCEQLPRLRTTLEPSHFGRGLGEGASACTTLTPPLVRFAPQARRERESVAGSMVRACLPYARGFITPMAAVAGAVADHVVAAMTHRRRLARAFVNNGGDIAFHLAPGHALRCGLVTELAAPAL